jgi:hypothetical protein
LGEIYKSFLDDSIDLVDVYSNNRELKDIQEHISLTNYTVEESLYGTRTFADWTCQEVQLCATDACYIGSERVALSTADGEISFWSLVKHRVVTSVRHSSAVNSMVSFYCGGKAILVSR